MNFTTDDINNQTSELQMGMDFLEDLREELGKASIIMSNVLSPFHNIIEERKSLYKTILALLLDSGVYSYTISDSVINEFTVGHKLNIEVSDETQSVTFSVIFPEQSTSENE